MLSNEECLEVSFVVISAGLPVLNHAVLKCSASFNIQVVCLVFSHDDAFSVTPVINDWFDII